MPRRPKVVQENLFSVRLNRLFAERPVPGTHPPRPWTLSEVSARTGIEVGYLSRARLGRIGCPGPEKIRALAAFFDVHPDYFTQERDEAAEAALLLSANMLACLRRPGMRQLLLRMAEYGPEELLLVEHLMDYVQSLRTGQRCGVDPRGSTNAGQMD